MENYETEHRERIRSVAPECCVLLKTNGKFPLKCAGKIALYGNGARRTLKGGRGSADVNVRTYTTAEQGLKNAGFTVTTESWMDGYERAFQSAGKDFRALLKEKIACEGMDRLMENLSIVMPEPEYDLLPEGEGDTAVYVLSRLCGEGVDRQAVKGDLYLSETEIRDILQLEKKYENFLLVLNTGCIVDLAPIADQVGNILLLSQLGMSVGDVLADLILGKAYPSGKLAATWAAAKDYCNVGEFGRRDDTRYREGIYVGYRYFDSVGKEPLFCFGHGLGYTDFLISAGRVVLKGTDVSVSVKVKNTGAYRGKEVVQLYVSLPEKELDQPFQTLAAFAKTKELLPGEEEILTLSFPVESLASTDSMRHQRVLEAGEYILRLGNSSRNTKICGVVVLDQRAVTEEIHPVGGETDFPDWKPDEAQRQKLEKFLISEDLSPETGTKTGETFEKLPILKLFANQIKKQMHHPPKTDPDALSFVQNLSDEELVYLCTGDFVGEGSKNVIGDAALTVAGAAGETTGRFQKDGVDPLIMADGPSGLRLSRLYGVDEQGIYAVEEQNDPLMEIEDKTELIPDDIKKILYSMMPQLTPEERRGTIHEQNCTAIPIAAALAQSWSTEAAETCAEVVAEEMKRFGIQIWLAPAMNIQRHPLCGRTFEYYSEDPLISGKMAAAVTKAIQKHNGCCVTIKHFICNNQEANRFRTNSMVNERALRDIYARGYEIAVKEAQPYALMSSYNLLNGVHTSERYDLLEVLLREEWGYRGMVMSDFLPGDKTASDVSNKYRKFASAPSIKAGNDLMMPGGRAHYENILKALQKEDPDWVLSRQEVERCAARNIELAWKLKGR